ncbi:MAG: methylated-DNA--[protein]-cysteine S-methyltransferase [Cyclobacteriaceae bacterium]|nr:methylated-DNA--[protein]-cysteine S-methyltransferase [Cyclobacteriaceae bacterium]
MLLISQEHHINYQRIAQAIEYLEKNVRHQPELDEVAGQVHLSPFHFQRLFTEWAGISPKRFLQFLTAGFLKKKLQESKNLEELAQTAGLSGASRVYDLFTTLEAVTPQEYKLSGAGIQLAYGFHQTPFGSCLIGVTERGVCWLSFFSTDDDGRHELENMKAHWHNSVFHQNQNLTTEFVDTIFNRKDAEAQSKLHLFVKGTNFQIKVWEALLRIPMGDVTTYQDVAEKINNSKAMQAVGSAVGSNHIAYLIPCHRVIRKDGILGEYRWEATRKKSMIGWEMAKASGF